MSNWYWKLLEHRIHTHNEPQAEGGDKHALPQELVRRPVPHLPATPVACIRRTRIPRDHPTSHSVRAPTGIPGLSRSFRLVTIGRKARKGSTTMPSRPPRRDGHVCSRVRCPPDLPIYRYRSTDLPIYRGPHRILLSQSDRPPVSNNEAVIE